MEQFTLDKEVKVFYVKAKSFPDGVLAAHQELHAQVPYTDERRYFGISRPENGVITYRAAAEEMLQGEAKKLGFETLTIKSGTYASIVVQDFMTDIQSIGRAFRELLASPGIDRDGYCVEWYLKRKDVRCMVRMRSEGEER